MTDKRIVDFLTLERIEDDIFRGESRNLGTPQIYGGQVLGQSMTAAQATVEGREAHSVHAYFLRRGDFEAPIIYQVDRSRDGGSFAARRVVAIQHGKPIFTMSASFQKHEQGLEYYETVDELPKQPNSLDEETVNDIPPEESTIVRSGFGFYTAPAKPKIDSLSGEETNNSNRWWIKAPEAAGQSSPMHKSVIAYISDAGLIATSAKPHGYKLKDRALARENFMMTSLDHAIWFHRPFNVDEWLLYECTAISTGNGRGLVRGAIYDPNGTLVVTCIQEGVVREKRR